MMAQVNAGRVRFVGRGEYNNSTQYYVFDLVSYNGNSYYAKADTIGNLPTNTTYWQLVAEKGNTGDTGPTGNGISSIAKTSTSGLVDTYTITYTNGNTTTFDVSNGNGIDRIEKTATVGNKDTYTIYFTNGSTTTYEVSNGEVTREELEEEVERLSMIYNAFPSTTGEVEEGSINGTAEVPFKEIGLKGNTSQESTTGKNLFDISKVLTNGTALVNNGNGTITVTAQSNNSQVVASEPRKLKDYCPNLQVGDSVYLTANSTGTSKYIYLVTTAQVWAFGTQRTITQNDLDSTVGWYASGVNTTATISDIMVSTSGGDYEPYTGGNPAPNPDYPSPVNVVTGDNEVKVEGKNLLDTSKFTTSTNITNIDVNTSVLNINGNDTSGWAKIFDNLDIPNGNYTIICQILSGTYTGGNLCFFDFNNTQYSFEFNFRTGGNTYNFTLTNGLKQLKIYSPKCSSNVELKIWFVKGTYTSSTIGNYEPYQSQTYPINLGSMELCKIGDYQDYLYKENGIWYKYGAIGKVVFDGSENWGGTAFGGYYRTQVSVDDIIGNLSANDIDLYSNYFYGNNGALNSEQAQVGMMAHYRANNNVYFVTNETNYNAFKVWLSTHNMTFYYRLATPTITPITDTTLIEQLDNLEKAYSYDTQTNISQTNQDKPFIISYEAILSLRNVLNS